MRHGLDEINLVKNCPMSWDSMSGGDRVRHCGKCRKNVYNIEDLTRQEAEDLIQDSGGTICARFYRRKDGTIVTRDCGRLATARVKLYTSLTALAAVVGWTLMPVHATGVISLPELEALDVAQQNRVIAQLLKEEEDPEVRKELRRSQANLRNRIRKIIEGME